MVVPSRTRQAHGEDIRVFPNDGGSQAVEHLDARRALRHIGGIKIVLDVVVFAPAGEETRAMAEALLESGHVVGHGQRIGAAFPDWCGK